MVRGSVSLSADRILVTVELLQGDSGDRLWSDSFERPLQDMFTVQWQIAETVAAELNLDCRRRTGGARGRGARPILTPIRRIFRAATSGTGHAGQPSAEFQAPERGGAA